MSNPRGRRTKISNQSASSSSQASVADLNQRILPHPKSYKGFKKPTPATIKIAAYAGVFAVVISLVSVGYRSPQDSASVASLAQVPTSETTSTFDSPSVDQLLATNIAADLAETANLPVAANVANLSVSLTAKSEFAQADETSISKPQIVSPTASSREIISYTVQSGESVGSLASRFGISKDTLKWANNLSSDALESGRELTILPIDGIRYTIKDGDSVNSIADKYKADKDRIVSFNDLELGGLTNGQQIIIPDGVLPETERPGYTAPAPVYNNTTSTGGAVVSNAFALASSGNRYAFGNCTWYAYERRAQLGRPIGSFWGNANTWDTSAMAAGLVVNKTPAPGAIVQWNEYSEPYISYAGHVGVVESVNSDGTIVITEMNNYAYGGFNIVNSRTIHASAASNYIH